MNRNIQFIKSQKGKDLLILDGFTFTKEKAVKDKNIWKCTEYSGYKCPARCHTRYETLLTADPILHNHVPNPAKIGVKKMIGELKDKSTSTQESPHQLISSALEHLPTATAGVLPAVSLLKRTIQRKRCDMQAPMSVPTDISLLTFPLEYIRTQRDELFLQFDSGFEHGSRILIFSTQNNLELMSQCQHWYADGTFKTCPPLFSQLYTIHAVMYSNVIPTVFVLMSDRRRSSYIRVFTELNRLNANLNPISIMTDFESSSLLAFKTVYPTTRQRGCLFHFSQCIWRHIQRLSTLRIQYSDDPECSLAVKELMALAFVPIPNVVQAFECLLNSPFYVTNETLLRDLVGYFEDTWIGKLDGQTRRQPIFDLSMWNCYEDTLLDLPKTNNSVEGWHRGFSQLLSAHHPSIWKFIKGLKKEQNMNELKIEQYISGQRPPQSKSIYREVTLRIKSIVGEYNTRPLLDYLRGIAHNLNLQV